MSKFIAVLLVLISIQLNAQITWEHTYDSASTWNFCAGNISQLLIVDLESSGEHYIKVNKCGKMISLYDLSHNNVKNISIDGYPFDVGTIYGGFLYFSEHLFDNDSELEYMYIHRDDSASEDRTTIYNEDGTILFSEIGAPNVLVNFHQYQYPIYNTSNGTKMILSKLDGSANVYSLPGSLSNQIEKKNNKILEQKAINSYPNPTNGILNIEMKNITLGTSARIIIYSLKGQMIKTVNANENQRSITIETSDMANGLYYYTINSDGQIYKGQKFIVAD